MTVAVVTMRNAVAAEAIRTGGRYHVMWTIGVPLAIASGALITLAVAVVAERFAMIGASSSDPTSIQVTSVTTGNAAYWIITCTVTVGAVIATYAQASAMRAPVADLERLSFPNSAVMPLARWVYYGTITAAMSTFLVLITLTGLPTSFPLVYGGVDVMSDAGLRFVWSVPAYGFGACGFGVGLAAIVGNPAGAIAALLGWMYVVETTISLTPNGYALQAYMPFLNAVYGTGQELAFTAPWSPNGALRYFGVVVLCVVGAGLWRARRRRR